MYTDFRSNLWTVVPPGGASRPLVSSPPRSGVRLPAPHKAMILARPSPPLLLPTRGPRGARGQGNRARSADDVARGVKMQLSVQRIAAAPGRQPCRARPRDLARILGRCTEEEACASGRRGTIGSNGSSLSLHGPVVKGGCWEAPGITRYLGKYLGNGVF